MEEGRGSSFLHALTDITENIVLNYLSLKTIHQWQRDSRDKKM